MLKSELLKIIDCEKYIYCTLAAMTYLETIFSPYGLFSLYLK